MKEFMCDLAKKAGALAMEYFNGIRPNEVHSKATAADIVSTADGQVERMIFETIRQRFPDHSFFGEETGRSTTDSEYCWVIDPIDGTQSFVKQHVYFSVSIALQKNGETIAGLVYAPAMNQLFYAEKGKGAFLNEKPIHVSGCTDISEAACATGFACVRGELNHNGLSLFCALVSDIRDIKRCGSAALDLCNVACGKFEGFWEYNLNLYDIAAGALILQEAGGEVRDYMGGTDYPAKGILAANPVLMPKFLEYTKKF